MTIKLIKSQSHGYDLWTLKVNDNAIFSCGDTAEIMYYLQQGINI